MMLGDFGHQRASNKQAVRDELVARIRGWMGFHLRGRGTAVPAGAIATTQTCPRDAPAAGPFRAPTFWGLSRGEVRYSIDKAQTVESTGGDPRVGAALDPVAGSGDACVTTPAADQPGTATYRLPPSTGYTLLGSPTVISKLAVTGQNAQVAARLWDVAPDATQTLVARGTLRPQADGNTVWQLHPGAWTFAPGHVPKLELLGNDAPSMRPSNGTFSVRVERLELRLPVRDRPDCRVVQPKAAPVVPPGQRLASAQRRRVAARGRLRPSRASPSA
jgi:predicted acyl esterase